METTKCTCTFQDRALDLLVEYDAARAKHISRGEHPPIRQAGLIPARNSQCPCGSGKKYKVCCRKAQPYVG